ICEEIDEKLGLPPGSSYEFLESWLGGSARQLLEEISRTLTPDFIKQLRQIVNKYEDVKKEIDKISKELKSLRNEIEEVSKAVARVKEFTFIYNSLKDKCKEVCPKLMHPTKDRGIPPPTVFESDWIGLGIDVVKGTVGRYQLVKSGEFERYAKEIEEGLKNGEFVIVVGNRGIGKSVLTRYVLAKLIYENDNIWVVTPEPSKPGKNWPVDLAIVLCRQPHIHIIIYYDPSAPDVYWGIEKTGIPGAVEEDMVEAVRIAYVNARATGGVSALLVIPSDFKEIIDKISKMLEKHKLKAHIIELDLRQEDFLRDIIKAYSGCEVIPDELVEGVRGFSSYTLVAKLVGEWLQGKCDKARVEVEAALRKSEGDAKRFIARYIWEVVFQENEELARIEAIPLLIRAHFGPIPRKFFEEPLAIENNRLKFYNVSKIIHQATLANAFTTWLSTPKEDLIEEVLREITLGEEYQQEFKDFTSAIREVRNIILIASMITRHDEKTSLLSLSTEYLFRMLQRELRTLQWEQEGKAVECLRRAIYILGSAISGHYFEHLFTGFRESYGGEEFFKIADSCRFDDLLLVDGEIPLLVRGAILLRTAHLKTMSLIILPSEWICTEARKVRFIAARKRFALSLVPYTVGLAFASLKTCKDKMTALYLLHWSLDSFGPLAGPGLILNVVKAVGESLKWPEELAPLLYIASMYIYSDDQVKNVSKMADQLYRKKNKMKGWAKAYLCRTYSQLALKGKETDKVEEHLMRAKKLRKEIREGDEWMGLITDAMIMGYIAEAYIHLGKVDKAKKALIYLSEVLQNIEAKSKEIYQKSSNVRIYLKFWSRKEPEQAIRSVLEDARMEHLHACALIELDKGLRENDKNLLSKAAEDFSKAAELAKNLGEKENYVILRGKSARMRVLLVDKLNEEVLDEFREIWREALESRRPTRGYLSTLAFALAEHLVALALSGGDWGELLEKYHFLLKFDPRLKVATLYMLNILAGCKEKPSDEEAYLAAGVMERVKRLKEEWSEELRSLMIILLKDRGVEIGEEVRDEELWELVSPSGSLSRFILLLKALSNGDYRLAKLHAQVGRIRLSTSSGLFGELAEALEECEESGLTNRVKLALAKLFYFHF
ncbi:MAG: hypothetical protein QXU69_08830, partial [Thermofilaceae archaeon]